MPRWHAPDLTADERQMLEALDSPNPDEWSTAQKREWEAMSAVPDWYDRLKASWRAIDERSGSDGDHRRSEPTPRDGRKKVRKGPGEGVHLPGLRADS